MTQRAIDSQATAKAMIEHYQQIAIANRAAEAEQRKIAEAIRKGK